MVQSAWHGPLVGAFGAVAGQRYAEEFERHYIDVDHGPLTEGQMREMGVPVGHRRQLADLMGSAAGRRASSASAPRVSVPAFRSVGGSIEVSTAVLPDATQWWDIGGRAPTMAAFEAFIAEEVLRRDGRELFPPDFLRAFQGYKPMPYSDHAYAGDGRCLQLVLRTPKLGDVQASRATVRHLTDLFVVMVRMDAAEGCTVVTVHRRAAGEIDFMEQLADDARCGRFPRADDLLEATMTSVAKSAKGSLEWIRGCIDKLIGRRLSDDPRGVVEELLLRGRQAQTLRRTLKANRGAMQHAREFDASVAGWVRRGVEVAEGQQGLAEELEEVATSTMDVRITLIGFRTDNNMRLFTYFSIVIQPLALMTGWYGMNWDPLPELTLPNGYYAFIGAAGGVLLLLIALLVWFTRDPPSVEEDPTGGEGSK